MSAFNETRLQTYYRLAGHNALKRIEKLEKQLVAPEQPSRDSAYRETTLDAIDILISILEQAKTSSGQYVTLQWLEANHYIDAIKRLSAALKNVGRD